MLYTRTAKLQVRNAVVLFVLCAVWMSGELQAEELEISAGQFLSFDKPAGFEVGISHDPDDEFRPRLKFSHFAQSGIKDFGFKVSVHTSDKEKMRDESLALELMSDLCGRLKTGSAEGKVDIQKYAGKRAVLYCSTTDASLQNTSVLPPGSYRNITVAFSRYEGYGFTAIAYSQSEADSLFQDFLSAIATLAARESAQRRR